MQKGVKLETEEVNSVRVVFGLEAQGHIEYIQSVLNKWNKNEYDVDMTYTKEVWDEIGKSIGWCPFTASLAYFKYLNNLNKK